jgi:hypothetical protein
MQEYEPGQLPGDGEERAAPERGGAPGLGLELLLGDAGHASRSSGLLGHGFSVLPNVDGCPVCQGSPKLTAYLA